MLGRPILLTLLAGAALAASPALAAVPNGTFKGDTSQDLPIKLKVKNDEVKLDIKVSNNCGATDKPIVVTSIPLNAKGKFNISLGDGELTAKASFTQDTVTGQLRQRYKDALLGNCDTKKITFTAER